MVLIWGEGKIYSQQIETLANRVMNTVEFFQFTYQINEARLSKQGQSIEMRNKLHQLLAYFLKRPNQVIRKEDLLNAVWTNGEYRERSLSQSLLELRKILGDSVTDPSFIRTVPNQGYIWIAPIVKSAEELAGTVDDNSRDIASHRNQYLVYNSRYWLLAAVAIGVLWLLFWLMFWPQTERFSFNESDKLRIGVLPFKNHTQQVQYKWVEYGLSDMLATDLIQFEEIDVINPSELANERDHKNVQGIIQDKALDVLIAGEFNQTQHGQTLHYTLLAADLSAIKGRFQADDLAFSMPLLTSEVHQKLRPSSEAFLNTNEWQVDAMYEYAKGQHAIVEHGCSLAQHYFAAAVVIDPTHYWSQLQLVFCQLELKKNAVAEETLHPLLVIDIDDSFGSLKSLALAQLMLNQKDSAQAEYHLNQSAYKTQLANSAQWLSLGRKIERSIQSFE